MHRAAQDLSVSDDIVIVGGGPAGLFCALKMAPRPVTLVTPHPVEGKAGTAAAPLRPLEGLFSGKSSPETLAAETIEAGAGLADAHVVALMAREAPDRISDLAAHGVEEGMTGAEITAALHAAVAATPSVRVIEGYALESLTRDGSRIGGLIAIADDPAAGASEIRLGARAVILASGGIASLYAETTNPVEAHGQGLAAAARAGALVADAEFVTFSATAAQFHIGGVLADASGRTSIDGLSACGEVAATGVHGADCLAANPFLEALVFAARTAEDVRRIYPAPVAMPRAETLSDAPFPGLFLEGPAIARLRTLMSGNVGPRRTRAGLVTALAEIAAIEREGGASHGFRNMITAARLIAYAALVRSESRGVHRRADFPERDPAKARRNAFTLHTAEAGIRETVGREQSAHVLL
ncbi:FAD-binding protein [Microbaculum marinum]|uniref:FAD-binding protein n=1 Tax=Microbaculum marinum TaxID=1764581 RepID=A0AAW9RIE6_9HYPH